MEFDAIYRYLRLKHYQNLFSIVKEKLGSLSATEAFSVEIIYLLGEPTLGEFADFIGISQPNATYKVNSLAAKGYIEKSQSPSDRRECRLVVTEKFRKYYGVQIPEMSGITEELSPEETRVLQKLTDKVSKVISRLTHEQEVPTLIQ